MNLLHFEIKLDYFESLNPKAPQLVVECFIDGKTTTHWQDLPIDILELVDSVKQTGEYHIWTCTCGIPECGGIKKGITVEIRTHSVTWKHSGRPLEHFGTLEFDRTHYEQCIQLLWHDYKAYFKWLKAAKTEFGVCPDLKLKEIGNRIYEK